MERRITQIRTVFRASSKIFCFKKIAQHLKTKVFNQYVLPAEKSAEKLRVAKRAMERSMLGRTLMHKKRNKWIREKTEVVDVMKEIEHRKWTWKVHIARLVNSRWARRVLSGNT